MKLTLIPCYAVLTYPRFKINKYSTGDIMFIVCLVEEDIFTVPPFCGPLLQDAVFTDSMFRAKTLPEDGSH